MIGFCGESRRQLRTRVRGNDRPGFGSKFQQSFGSKLITSLQNEDDRVP